MAGELPEGVLVVVALFARPIEESRFEAEEVGAVLYVLEQAVEGLTVLGIFGRGEERDELPAERIHLVWRDFAAEGAVNEASSSWRMAAAGVRRDRPQGVGGELALDCELALGFVALDR